ncbi:hypothetical protein [Streptomyces globisporus]|uniref:hypothetical protein n=1 Tax=Streptomyces globisporus TaxID=1908 RepID=UPI00345F8287
MAVAPGGDRHGRLDVLGLLLDLVAILGRPGGRPPRGMRVPAYFWTRLRPSVARKGDRHSKISCTTGLTSVDVLVVDVAILGCPGGRRHSVDAGVVARDHVVAILGSPGGATVTAYLRLCELVDHELRSSAGPEDDHHADRSLISPWGRSCDSRPPRRATATMRDASHCSTVPALRSSVTPKDDRHGELVGPAVIAVDVAILGRLEGRPPR